MQEKLYTKAETQQTEKGLLAVATTAVEDRHGEVVSVEGWDMKNFKKNPVLLWAHDHAEIAVGMAKNLKLVDKGSKSARWVFEPVFHDLTPAAKALKALYNGYTDSEGNQIPPVLNSFSVGFRPTEMEGNTYTKQELLEISAVNVPANPEARVMAYKALKGVGTEEETMRELGAWIDKEKDISEVEELKSVVASQQEQIDELVKGLKHLNPHGRKSEVVTQRLALSKVVARAADKILEGKPSGDTDKLAKVIKRATEKLIVDQKEELKTHGKN